MQDFLLELVEGCMFHHLFAEWWCRQAAEFYSGFLADRLLTVWLRLALMFG